MIPARAGVRSSSVEAALVDLERALCRDRCHVVVSASTGPAKTLLLGALAERVAGALRVIPLPEPDAGDDLCSPILRELGEPCGEDPESSLLGVIQRLASQGSALALVAGDAPSLTQPVLRRLGRLAARARRGLRLVLVSDGMAGSNRDAIAEFMAPLGIGAVKVELDAPLQREHTPAAERPAPAPVPSRMAAPAEAGRAAALAAMRLPRESRRTLRTVRLAVIAVAAVAVGFVAVNRIELLRPRRAASPPAEVAAPQAAPVAAPVAHPAPRAAVDAAPAPRRAADAAPARPPRRPAVAARAERAVSSIAAPEAAPTPVPAAAAPAAPIELVEATQVVAAAEPVVPELPAPVPAADVPAEPVPAEPPVRTIRVNLNAQPWAHIEVDGREVGVTPMADLQLTAGPHRFRARFPDGRVMERTVRIDALRDHITFP